jgi:hypothetical protein
LTLSHDTEQWLHEDDPGDPGRSSAKRGWRAVFGRARREDVEPVDARIAEELERVDPDEWR